MIPPASQDPRESVEEVTVQHFPINFIALFAATLAKCFPGWLWYSPAPVWQELDGAIGMYFRAEEGQRGQDRSREFDCHLRYGFRACACGALCWRDLGGAGCRSRLLQLAGIHLLRVSGSAM